MTNVKKYIYKSIKTKQNKTKQNKTKQKYEILVMPGSDVLKCMWGGMEEECVKFEIYERVGVKC